MVDWDYIDTKYPTSLNKDSMPADLFRKERTIELYDYLPQTTLEERYTYTDIRDAVIELNYTFFGYVATHTFINNSSISYEDKFQSALLHFCEMWHKYRFAAKYRTDLSFAVFFKLRVGECIERELNEVKYSIRRSMCMEVGKQVGKHWGQVTYEDLKNVDLPADKMDSLKAMFGSLYVADLDTNAMFITAPAEFDPDYLYSDNYNTLEGMLMHEMIIRESTLSDKDLLELSMMLDVPFEKLKNLVPKAMEHLHKTLLDALYAQDAFENS